MLTLLSELKFVGGREDELSIKEGDFGAFSVHRKRTSERRSLLDEVKRDYLEKRSVSEKKVKSALKHFEEALKTDRIVHCAWINETSFHLLLASGLLVYAEVNIATGDIVSLAFDKFLVGKIISEHIVDVIVTQQHVLISYNENQITFLYLQKPSGNFRSSRKISSSDPKIFNVIVGSHAKKANRHLVMNVSGNLVLIWTKSSQNEFYPWRPLAINDQERANLHVYRLDQVKFEHVCYHWTENDPIGFEFSRFDENELLSVEQKMSRKGEVTAEIVQYRLNSKSRIERTAVTSIPLQTEISAAFAFSPDHEKLVIGCIDGSIVLFDRGREVTYLVKASFIPTTIAWHPDSALIVIANDRAQLQCFDISLACIKHQLLGEEMTPASILDVSGFFARQPSLTRVVWSKKPDINNHHRHDFAQVDAVLLMMFESGTFGVLKYIGGAGLRNDIHTSGLTADVIIQLYISLDQLEKAISILQCLNWDTYGAMCLLSLHKIANYIFKLPATEERVNLLQRALASFYVPAKKLCFETENEFGDNVDDIMRRLFFYLVRYKHLDKAFCLAIDINDADLFMIIHKCARATGELDVANEAFRKAEEIYASEENDSHHSSCSLTSCSICSFSCDSDEESENSSEFNRRRSSEFPPLPIFPPAAESVKGTDTLKKATVPQPPPPLPSTDEAESYRATNELTLQNLSKFNKESTHTELDQSIGIPVPPPSVSYSQWQPTTIHTYPLISGTIPSIGLPTTSNYHPTMPVPIALASSSKRKDLAIPTNSILSNPNTAREAGETKNKVKFSDTITVAVVPEIGRNEKIFNHPERVKHKMTKFTPPHIYDPRRELAESLPLCHPNEDYLKDFLPMGKEAKGKGGEKKPAAINIVNFGLL